ncbi:winged helix-turn-helix domain-containing protein [Micromonospora sp. LOL_025]|uniref:helix-turn-helix domain-containing protein n=1 Tax=Micromonospora sp. LOL_025 TaxID=3345413 RepID=UPI003A8A14A3
MCSAAAAARSVRPRPRPAHHHDARRAVGISISSASEHAGALRAAGLVSSVRDGGAVLHRLTPLGVELLGRVDVLPPAPA